MKKMQTCALTFILLLFFIAYNGVGGFRCDRRPYGTTSLSSAPDGRFKLLVLGTDNTYIPNQLYTVQITEKDDKSQFIGFMISAEGDNKPDPRNPRRTVTQFPGTFGIIDPLTAMISNRCAGSVEQASSAPKSSVEVHWRSPPSGNGCVTLRAMVAENEDTWYEDGPPLTLRICEDMRQPDDAAPQINEECNVCGEAKYEVQFTGMWSRNTHPQQYPENDWVPRYSELVGASHGINYILWAPGSLVSEGFRDLVEYANASKLEAEILEKVGDDVRTLIKAKGLAYPKMDKPTYAIFRTDKVHHLMTVAVALVPSPDWFLGVTRFELCQDKSWVTERELYLYPWDAGTNSGVSYESSKIQTFPQDIVSRVEMNSHDRNSPFFELDIRDLHPFGKLNIRLIRTYHDECEDTTDEGGETATDENANGEDKETEPEPSRYQNSGRDEGEEPIIPDPDVSEDCPMSQWQEWSVCEGRCVDGVVRGYKWRERYHLVDGVPIEKYDAAGSWRNARKEVPQKCKAEYDDFEQVECEESCDEAKQTQDITARRRVMTHIVPGKTWSKKRDVLPKNNIQI